MKTMLWTTGPWTIHYSLITWFWHKGQGSWVNSTSAIILFKGILWGLTAGRAPSFDFYSTIDLRCGLIYWTETRPPFCTVVYFMYILMDPDPNIWCEDQHRLTTKKFLYLELKRNWQFYRLSAEQITIRLPAPLMTKRKQLWNNFCIKIICQSHHTHFISTSDKIYMTNKTWLSNIPLIDSNTHEYAMVVLSQLWTRHVIIYIVTGRPEKTVLEWHMSKTP
jgi:hypothetical protein